MKVTVNQPSLAKALSLAGRAVSSRSSLPVLANILLEAKDGQLHVAGTNREIGINVWIGARVEDEGAITIPAKLLTEFVNILPPEQITIELNVRTQTAHLTCARFDANIKGIDAFEFPSLPTLDGLVNSADGATGLQVALSPNELRTAIDQTTFAASADENRPALTGVEVTFTDDDMRMAATDGYRLSIRDIDIDGGPAEKASIIVPARSLGDVARISSEAQPDEPMHVLVTPKRNQVLFAATGSESSGIQRVELISELIEARYPDYMATVPKSRTTRTTINTTALIQAVRVALLFARDNANIVRLSMAGVTLTITAAGAETGDHSSEVAATVDGSPIEIAMNAKYMIDALSQIDRPQVALETTTSTRPMALKPIGQDEYQCVIMPIYPPQNGKSK